MAAKKKASKKQASSGITIAGQLKKIQSEHGDSVAVLGPHWDNTLRAPTGCFPFDYATGGGFPRGRISIVWGKEGSGKTTTTLMAIARYQQDHPDKLCVFVDVEGHYDTAHGRMLGVDNSKLVYVNPGDAEQVVDIVEQFLYADDCGIVVVDSLAALVTVNELESSADKAVVGGAGLVVGKLYRKVSRALNKARQMGHLPTFVAINQVRFKIGVMYGNPETMPGGNAFKFASSLTVYCSGKRDVDGKLHPDIPVWHRCKFTIQKYKIPILAKDGEFSLAIADTRLFGKGYIDDWKTVKARLTKEGLLNKLDKNAGWDCCGYEFGTQQAIRTQLKEDPEFYALVIDAILTEALKETQMEDGHAEDEQLGNDDDGATDDPPFDLE